jgi:hypothetical protein
MTQLLWILNPLTQYVLLALTLTACLAMSLSMKREMDAMRRSNREAAAASVATQVAEPATPKREGDGSEVPFVPGQDLNLTRRAQAIRMQRRGESAATIAAALRVPRNEIELLLKIQKLTGDHEQRTVGPLDAVSGD